MTSDSQLRLFNAAMEARQHAHAPYSNFSVGAAVLTCDGRIFSGCNVENASYPLGWCAEVSALGAAISAGARQFAAIAIVADADLCTPCGGCRQRLTEFASPNFELYIFCLKGLVRTFRLSELLSEPFKFTG